MRTFISILFAFVCVALATTSTPPTPVWPSQYMISGTFTIPTWPANIEEQITVYMDNENNRQRIEYYDGRNVILTDSNSNTTYVVNPRIDTPFCWGLNSTDGGGGPLVQILPPLSGWTFITEVTGGPYCPLSTACQLWQNNVTNFGLTAVYSFYVNYMGSTPVPVTLTLHGYDFVFGSHPDVYILAVETYASSLSDMSVFDPPSLCAAERRLSEPRTGFWSKQKAGELSVFVPPKYEGATLDPEFERFKLKHRKYYFNTAEHETRLQNFRDNARFIAEHNANPAHSYKLAMNHLGDLTAAERKYLLHPSRTGKEQSGAAGTFVRTHAQLPKWVDWVAAGKVQPPKDQGVCGSCWTFGTQGSVEGAWAVKHGVLPNLSEQQLVDCAWGVSPTDPTQNQGCAGGFAANAMEWIIQNGGIASESAYPYLMQDSFCNAADHSSGVTLKAYYNITSGDEDALTEAVAKIGPIAVAIDAAHPEFEFYSHGVFDLPTCQSGIDDLDHEVLVVGYGTNREGTDFYMIKNSWSDRWGHDGYILFARGNKEHPINECGVATCATAPIVA